MGFVRESGREIGDVLKAGAREAAQLPFLGAWVSGKALWKGVGHAASLTGYGLIPGYYAGKGAVELSKMYMGTRRDLAGAFYGTNKMTREAHGALERVFWPTGKVTRFLSRNPLEHINAGLETTARSFKPSYLGMELGVSTLFAAMATDYRDMLKPEGFAREFTSMSMYAPGWVAGGMAGAAIGSAILPGIGTAVGYLAGAFMGSEMTESVAMLPWELAERGKKLRYQRTMPTYIDTPRAATSRQRAMGAIYQSQLNARSSLGMEAITYHR